MIQSRKFLIVFIVSLLAVSTGIFGQNQKADGYKGLWFKFGQQWEYGYKYSGGLGTFSSQHQPIAIYSPKARKTYFIYSGTTNPGESHLEIMISYFDHRRHKYQNRLLFMIKWG